MLPAVLQGAFVLNRASRVVLVEDNASVQQIGVQQADLNLVDDDGLADRRAQQRDLGGGVVAQPEMAHFAARVQSVEGRRHLVWLDQRIGPMQKQDVQIVGLQAFEAALHRGDDVVAPEVVAPGRVGGRVAPKADTALGLNCDLVAQVRRLDQELRKHLFRFARAVDVGMIEEVDALIQRQTHGRHRPAARGVGDRLAPAPGIAERHAAENDAGDGQGHAGQGYFFHDSRW